MAKATELELSEIHGSMAEWCRLVLKGVPMIDKEGAVVLQEDGTPWLAPPSPAHLSVVRQFLKDNKVDSPATAKKIEDLVPSLPSFEGESTFLN